METFILICVALKSLIPFTSRKSLIAFRSRPRLTPSKTIQSAIVHRITEFFGLKLSVSNSVPQVISDKKNPIVVIVLSSKYTGLLL